MSAFAHVEELPADPECIKYFYVTFTSGPNSITTSWRVSKLKYDLNKPRDLIAYIVEMEQQYPNFYLTWWKELANE